ncbi:HAD family hydrolase [Microbacterium terrisoli]|uniref:HAD family hydrolase n=1 Tax=Microbacterium terrisoli TaxID=3242192 RepID=UPI0028037C4A|nr:HAD family hydrolase [Microbacterium protaetiae]
MADRIPAELLVVDLDNTLWDWFRAWYHSFSALLQGLSDATGLPEAELERAIRPIHQSRGTSEYSWLIEELEVLRPYAHGHSLREAFDEALHAQNKARLMHTELYPGVLDTLRAIDATGTPIVAYTESLEYWTHWRIRYLDLDGVIDRLYSSPDHDAPAGVVPEEMRRYKPDAYGLHHTEHHHVPAGVLKPDPIVLQTVVSQYRIDPSKVVYVGDSLDKDVPMAQDVGVLDVWAKYGRVQHMEEYEQLRRVSHWPDAMIAQERSERDKRTPSFILENGLPQLLDIFDFRPRP